MKWNRPNGPPIETNDEKATIAHCLKIGWKEDKPAPKPKKKKVEKDGNSGKSD